MTDSELDSAAHALEISGLPLAETLDGLILAEGARILDVVRIVMLAYNLSLAEAKGAVETRCYELRQKGLKK